jgi:hypothetical protein
MLPSAPNNIINANTNTGTSRNSTPNTPTNNPPPLPPLHLRLESAEVNPPQSNEPGSFSFASQGAACRRPAMQAQGLEEMGGVGSGNAKTLGKSG